MTPTPAVRKSQADALRALVDQWEKAANAFDSGTAMVEAAQDSATAAFRAFNAVAWEAQEHSGATPAQKIDAETKQIAYETAAAEVPALFAAATAASLARGAIQQKLELAAAELKDNPSAVENTSGTPL